MSTDLLAIASRIAQEALDLARRRRVEGVEVAARKSSVVDVVTHADREVEALIRGRIADARPDDAFFGEESGASDVGASGLTWVVDPIDGTVNYLYGIPWSAVSIAVVDGPVELVPDALAGVVANLGTGELCRAAKGGGVTLDGTAPAPMHAPPLAELLLATGFSYDADARRRWARVLAGIVGEVRDIRRMGAAALDLVSVVAGRVDAYTEGSLHPWDVAAGALAVREGGGAVEVHDTESLLGPLIVAGHTDSVARIRRLLDDSIAALADPAR